MSDATTAAQAASASAAVPARDAMPRPMRVAESVFDICYLLFDLVAAIVFLAQAHGRTVFLLYGALALVLGGGDAFHLVPRVQMHLRGVRPNTTARLGLGTQVASVTMTVFYVLLYFIWRRLFPTVGVPAAVPALIFATAVLRIALCLMPQNDWLSGRENLRWSLYRNVPFAVTGVLVIVLFATSAPSRACWSSCCLQRRATLAALACGACALPSRSALASIFRLPSWQSACPRSARSCCPRPSRTCG